MLPSFVHPGPVSLVAFVVVCALVLSATLAGVHVAYRANGQTSLRPASIVATCILLWLGLASLPVASGWIAARPLPGVPLYFLAVNGAALAFACSPIGRKLATGLPLAALVGFHAFRLPLELVLHSWATQGTIPSTMTWTGQNYDIVTGILALIAAPWSARHRAIAWIANGVGFALLINVMRVAVMSSPFPFAWKVEPPLLLVLHLPYAWIVSICVAGALAGHVILTRALLVRRQS